MKEETTKFDFKFLNLIMYFGAAIIAYYVLKNLGIMDKVIQAIVALTPVYIGIIICWMSTPLTKKLKGWGLNQKWASMISLIIIFGIIALIIALVIPMLVEQVTVFAKNLPDIYRNVVEKVNTIFHQEFNTDLKTQFANLQRAEWAQKYFGNEYLGNALNYSLNTIQSAINVIVTIVTTIVVSFFMVKDMEKLKIGFVNFYAKNSKDKNKYYMLVEINDTLLSYIRGIVIDSFIVGLMTTVVCFILKLDYAVIFGIIIFILNFIPFIGAILSYIIASLYALTVGGPIFALITFISLLFVQMIDANILQPNIIGKSVNLHPVVVLAGLIVFPLFMGVFGMIIAVPVLAVIKVILKYKLKLNIEDPEEILEEEEEQKKKEKKKKESKISYIRPKK